MTRWPGRAAIALTTALLTAARPADARRDACGDSERPYVLLAMNLEPSQGLKTADFLAQIRPGLRARSIDICDHEVERSSPAIATLHLAPAAPGTITVAIEVRDTITRKLVSRDLDLSAVPADGRALALAIDADELLRATWAELALEDSPPPDRPVPAAVRATLPESLSPGAKLADRAPPAGFATLRGQVDAFSGGLVLVGGDIVLTYWFARRLGATLAGGYRMSPIVAVDTGTVQASALRASLGGMLALTPRASRAGLDLTLSFDALRIHFEPHPAPGVRGIGADDLSLTTTAILGGWVDLGAVRLSGGVGGAAPLRATAATTDKTVIISNNGAGFVGALGLGLPL